MQVKADRKGYISIGTDGFGPIFTMTTATALQLVNAIKEAVEWVDTPLVKLFHVQEIP